MISFNWRSYWTAEQIGNSRGSKERAGMEESGYSYERQWEMRRGTELFPDRPYSTKSCFPGGILPCLHRGNWVKSMLWLVWEMSTTASGIWTLKFPVGGIVWWAYGTFWSRSLAGGSTSRRGGPWGCTVLLHFQVLFFFLYVDRNFSQLPASASSFLVSLSWWTLLCWEL